MNKSIQSSGTTHGFGDVLGVNDRIAHMSSGVVSACIQKALDCDATMIGGHDYNVGDDTLLATQIQNVDLYFNDKAYDAAPFTAASDKTVAFTASWDPDMLHIAEWIKFIAAFFNLEDKAEAHFKKVAVVFCVGLLQIVLRVYGRLIRRVTGYGLDWLIRCDIHR